MGRDKCRDISLGTTAQIVHCSGRHDKTKTQVFQRSHQKEVPLKFSEPVACCPYSNNTYLASRTSPLDIFRRLNIIYLQKFTGSFANSVHKYSSNILLDHNMNFCFSCTQKVVVDMPPGHLPPPFLWHLPPLFLWHLPPPIFVYLPPRQLPPLKFYFNFSFV